ncbi:MAG: serine hydrolase [Eubacteriales bacterium]|nr:serine hydrolase [Eubacteriales bacterium]
MQQSRTYRRSRPNLTGPILLILAVVLITSGVLAYFRFFRVPFKLIEKKITLEIGSPISEDVADYVEADAAILADIAVDLSEIDQTTPGEYKLLLTYDDKEKAVKVVLADTVAPVAVPARDPVVVVVGKKLKAKDLVRDVVDATEVSFSFSEDAKDLVETMKVSEIGEQEIIVYLRDAAGNPFELPVLVNVVEADQNPPQFSGVESVELAIGQSFDALAGAKATDEVDGDLTDAIEVSGTVNSDMVGLYALTYTVTDSSGNQATFNRAVTVTDPYSTLRATNAITVTGSGAANQPLNAVLGYLGENVRFMSVVYQDLTTGDRFEINADKQYRSASTAKVFVNMSLYDAVDSGRLTLDQTATFQSSDFESGTGILQGMDLTVPYALNTLADYAVVYSDNIAFNMIRRVVGREESFAYYESIIGHPTDHKSTSMGAADGAALLNELYTSDSANLKHMLDMMKQTKFNDMLPKYLPAGTVAHKVGFYDTYYHDIGIVFAGDRPYILTVFSKGMTNPAETIAEISKRVYENR